MVSLQLMAKFSNLCQTHDLNFNHPRGIVHRHCGYTHEKISVRHSDGGNWSPDSYTISLALLELKARFLLDAFLDALEVI